MTRFMFAILMGTLPVFLNGTNVMIVLTATAPLDFGGGISVSRSFVIRHFERCDAKGVLEIGATKCCCHVRCCCCQSMCRLLPMPLSVNSLTSCLLAFVKQYRLRVPILLKINSINKEEGGV